LSQGQDLIVSFSGGFIEDVTLGTTASGDYGVLGRNHLAVSKPCIVVDVDSAGFVIRLVSKLHQSYRVFDATAYQRFAKARRFSGFSELGFFDRVVPRNLERAFGTQIACFTYPYGRP